MRVYRLREDVDSFQSISPVDQELWSTDQLIFDATKKIGWKPVKCYIQTPKLLRANFMYLCPGLLVFDQRTLDGMEDILEMSGEILQLNLDDEIIYGVNILACPNALDQSNTEWRISKSSGKKLGVKSYMFHSNRFLESSLFKVPETCRSDILTFVGIKDSGDEFKGRYEELGLTGLIFEDV